MQRIPVVAVRTEPDDRLGHVLRGVPILPVGPLEECVGDRSGLLLAQAPGEGGVTPERQQADPLIHQSTQVLVQLLGVVGVGVVVAVVARPNGAVPLPQTFGDHRPGVGEAGLHHGGVRIVGHCGAQHLRGGAVHEPVRHAAEDPVDIHAQAAHRPVGAHEVDQHHALVVPGVGHAHRPHRGHVPLRLHPVGHGHAVGDHPPPQPARLVTARLRTEDRQRRRQNHSRRATVGGRRGQRRRHRHVGSGVEASGAEQPLDRRRPVLGLANGRDRRDGVGGVAQQQLLQGLPRWRWGTSPRPAPMIRRPGALRRHATTHAMIPARHYPTSLTRPRVPGQTGSPTVRLVQRPDARLTGELRRTGFQPVMTHS